MPVPSMSLHVIKIYMAFEFICLGTFIHCSEFIFLCPLGTIINTLERRRKFFQLALVHVSSTNIVGLHVGYNLDFNLYKCAFNWSILSYDVK